MRLKKWVRNLVTMVFVMSMICLASISDFEFNIQSVLAILLLLAVFGASGLILAYDERNRIND